MTRAFVAGATGYTGRALVPALTARGVEAVAHVRPDSSRIDEWTNRFTGAGATVDTTAWDSAAMAGTLAELQPDLVFALLGTTRARGKKADSAAPETYETVDYGLTRLLVDAAAACGSRPRFVYLSSVGVGPNSRSAYIAARWKAEQALRDSGLPHVIVRPSFITGPGRDELRVGERVGAAVGNGLLSVVGVLGGRKVRDRYRSITNTQLADAMVSAALAATDDSLVIEGDGLRGASA